MDYRIVLNFFSLLGAVTCIHETYTVHLEKLSFEDAENYCRNIGSFLTNINITESSKILKTIKDTETSHYTSFWIGLKKKKEDCVQDLPLKGFVWTVDNSTEYDIKKWKEEPTYTCIIALCGLLSVEYKGSTIFSWGLASARCKQKFPFICKRKEPTKVNQDSKPSCPKLQLIGSHDTMQKNNDPYTLQVTCINKKTFTLTCSRRTGEWKLEGTTEANLQDLCLDCRKGFKLNESGNCVDIDECQQSHSCKQQCENTMGSYACVCFDETGKSHNEDSENCNKSTPPSVTLEPNSTSTEEHKSFSLNNTGDLSSYTVPVIIALLNFIVLIIIIAVIVTYCLMRRARKRAKKRAPLKEAVPLNGSDSLEKVNEKHF